MKYLARKMVFGIGNDAKSILGRVLFPLMGGVVLNVVLSPNHPKTSASYSVTIFSGNY